jgi:HSP20 family protein
MSLVKFKSNFADRPFDQVFKNFFKDDFDGFFVKPFNSNFTPAVNVVEKNDHYRIDFAVPGFSKGDFNVKMDGTMLTISGEKKNERAKEEENYTMREFSHQSFSRSFTLPESVHTEKISAEYVDGILKVNLPKKEEVKQKAIEIKVS